MRKDKRIVWKDQNDLKIILTISQFIEKYGIKSSRQYQKKLSENPNLAPSMWFIINKYGSWNNLLNSIGIDNSGSKKWAKLKTDDLIKVAQTFIDSEKIKSQRVYEQKSAGKDVPCLSTLKNRLGDVRFLFKKKVSKGLTNFEILLELKNEIIRLNMEDDLSMTKFQNYSKSKYLPSVYTIMRRTNKTWEELMSEIGFDYREIKMKKQRNNLCCRSKNNISQI
ncbi:hypothetical protein [Enterococcus faecium]|uniref:Uncharacterized protein n=1 Tax=Enterococcus faecium TaxID=1352 RepID=A0A242BCW6_ENTFC|nr:hypothetical protein [Enterococcus faecium]OTN93159.1 hypothetical protein A5810_002021 [Enterococcus faecium]